MLVQPIKSSEKDMVGTGTARTAAEEKMLAPETPCSNITRQKCLFLTDIFMHRSS